MEGDRKYTFFPVSENNFIGERDKNVGEFLHKWGLNFSVQEFLFNEPFHQYHKYQLIEDFFKDENVAKALKTYQSCSWKPHGKGASSVEIKQIPCSILNMTFFDKLKNPENRIVHSCGTICKRCDTDINGILVSDHLRGMLLDDESSAYSLYTDAEREEFIFRIFQMLVLGGELCQYEDEIDSYLTCTKSIYRDLIRVLDSGNSKDLSVGTMVLEVVAKDNKGESYYPFYHSHKQNNAFLLIDGDLRRIKAVAHQSSGYFA